MINQPALRNLVMIIVHALLNTAMRSFTARTFIFSWMLVTSPCALAATVHLQWGAIDTTAPATKTSYREFLNTAPAAHQVLSEQRQTAPWIVQFRDVIQEEWKDGVRRAGAEIKGYLPENALLIEARPNQIAGIATLPFVQWIGEYLPEYKRVLPARTAMATSSGELHPFNVILFNPDDLAVVEGRLARLGGVAIERAAPMMDRGLIRASLTAAAIEQISTWGEIEWIEPFVAPKWLNESAVSTNRMNVVPVWQELGLTGTNQVVAVCDTGLDSGNPVTLHPDLRGRLHWAQALGRTNRWDDPQSHGTHVSGSVLGNGAMSTGLYKGVAYEARLVMQSVLDPVGGMSGLPDDLNDLFYAAYTNDARIHSDSWGAAVEGIYTSDSRNLDMFVWNHRDMLIVFAAGNEGTDRDLYLNSDGVINLDSLSAPGTAKNCLTVGAAENFRTSGGYSTLPWGSGSWSNYYPDEPIFSDLISQPESPQGMAAFSSRGPCKDGRIKPDLVAPGTSVISTRSNKSSDDGWGFPDNTNYLFMGGTSMSTPLVSGAAALARQWLQTRQGIAQPSAALLKALLMNGARNMAPGQYGTGDKQEIPRARPNNVSGWGHVNLYDTLNSPAHQALTLIDSRSLSTGKTNTFHFTIYAPTTNKFVLTMAYSDYWGTYGAGKQLVNDLDLALITPSGGTVYPNNLAVPDATNNVETIEYTPAETGMYTVRVRGRNVPSGGSQPYALVVLSPVTYETNALAVSPVASIEAEGPQGGPFSSTGATFTIVNTAGAPINWKSAGEGSLSWLTISPTGGVLAAGATQRLDCAVNANAGALSAGACEGNIVISNATTGGSLERYASLRVRSLASFTWSAIPSPQQQNKSFNATLTAVDEMGETMTTFAQPVNLSATIAQTNQIGIITTNKWDYPINTEANNQRAQVIYLTNEIGVAGSIKGLYINVSSVPSRLLGNWTIRMKHTAWNVHPTNLWEGPASGWTTNYQSDFMIPSTGWVYFAFSQPFAYNGISNLMADFSFSNQDAAANPMGIVLANKVALGRSLVWETWFPGNNPLNWSGATFKPDMANLVPVIRLNIEASLPVTPAQTGAFTNGEWSGAVSVGAPAAAIALRASRENVSGYSNPFDVTAANASVYLQSLTHMYDGAAKHASATTDPAGLTVTFTYNGLTNAPSGVGAYAVTGTVQDAQYQGYDADTFIIERGEQTITFDPIPDPFADETVTLNATASSGLPVNYLITGPAIRDQSSLTFSGTGEVTVVATQSGNTNWLPAAQVTNTFTVRAAIDANTNSVPDEWEMNHFGNLTNVTAISDFDEDGKLDWEEYVADTDPRNPASFQSLELFSMPFSNGWNIVFDTATGRIYQVEVATQLFPSAWQPLFTNLPGTGETLELEDTNTAPARFYRQGITVHR